MSIYNDFNKWNSCVNLKWKQYNIKKKELILRKEKKMKKIEEAWNWNLKQEQLTTLKSRKLTQK